ncbi:hypothetical protein Poli38472_009330 [Pythium oligandrum]|uniref:Uncharacterized protein n=1 Tax=Pythium oligandrum TaxID=41045 RepID=A0A8K1CLI8_PYTOL|nr:hypothetical protein Poli38472_009330 [Pythium oligandrum]|eukprot:TMW65163.1 hypothetical protein Poli38472_009330 [Pythium oligandrum]
MTSTLSKGDNGFVTFTFILSGSGATTDDHSAKFPSVEGASIVANITNVENAKNAKVTFTQCNPGTTDAETRVRQLGATNSTTPEVGKLFVIDSNCLTVEVSAPNSKNGRLDIEAALIGDFCKRSPSADVCEKYDPGVVMPADTKWRSSKSE